MIYNTNIHISIYLKTHLLDKLGCSLAFNLENFSIFPGSELKLLKGLELGCSGIITATCNVTAEMSRKVYDDFYSKKKQSLPKHVQLNERMDSGLIRWMAPLMAI